MRSSKLYFVGLIAVLSVYGTTGHAEVASKGYVDEQVAGITGNMNTTARANNAEARTAAAAITGEYPSVATTYNIANDLASDASVLSSGTVKIQVLPVGETENTVAAGADKRFDTVSTQPLSGDPGENRAFIWFE